MTSGWPRPYADGDAPASRSVDLTVIVLTCDESANISQCLRSCAWAAQVLIVDSGSTDATVSIARTAGADVVETYWRGFGAQRQFALDLPDVEFDWVMFVDADEWVSQELAAEIADLLAAPNNMSAYSMYFRLVFQGRWIKHCGWYRQTRLVRLMRRGDASYGIEEFSEHPEIRGQIGKLENDIVDEDRKGLSAWLIKHVGYARLEANRRRSSNARGRLAHQSVLNHMLKNKIAPRLPLRPALQFAYMYLVRGGFRDGREGLLFCLMHAWFQLSVEALAREGSQTTDPGTRP